MRGVVSPRRQRQTPGTDVPTSALISLSLLPEAFILSEIFMGAFYTTWNKLQAPYLQGLVKMQ